MHPREAVEERARQALTPATLLQRVLRAKDAEGYRAAEGAPQLRDEDLRGKQRDGQAGAGCRWS